MQSLQPLLPSSHLTETHFLTQSPVLAQVGPGQAFPFLLQATVLSQSGYAPQVVQSLQPLLPSGHLTETHFLTQSPVLAQVGEGQAFPFLLQVTSLLQLG